MAVKYRVDFGTFSGHQTNWQLDILNDDYSGAVLDIITDVSPIEISYTKDYDGFSPFITSVADVTLLKNDTVTYDEFQQDPYGTWRCRLSYEDPSNAGNYLTYWEGYIIAESYVDEINTDPYAISFTATDGLGYLSRLSIEDLEDEDHQTLLEYLRRGLDKTGLDLPIYYKSGIENTANGNDYLTEQTVSPYAFYTDDLADTFSHYERMESILNSCNCRVFQARGRWYITNTSSHGGTRNSGVENITWKVISSTGTAQSDVTEDLNYQINSNDATELISLSGLSKENREPYFSVAQQVENYTVETYNQNPLFELSATGYTWPNSGIPQQFSTTTVLNGARSVMTNITDDEDAVTVSTSNNDRWFNTDYIDGYASRIPIKVSFDYNFDFNNDNITGGEVRFRIIQDIDDGTGGFFGNVDYWVWNFERSIWSGIDTGDSDGDNGFDPKYIGRANSSSEGQWNLHEVSLNTTYFTRGDNRRFRIEFFSPLALSNDDIVDGTNIMTTFIDNVRIQPNVSFNEPHFEYHQPTSRGYTKEYVGSTSLTTRGDDIFFNRLPITSLRRDGKTEDLSVEEIVTLQRLNDYRDFGEFYRGDFVNNTSTPLSFHHKPHVGFDGQNETESLISDEMRFNPRTNVVSLLSRVPNQSTDVSATFVTYDIEPVAPQISRGPLRSQTLNITTTGVDDSGNAITFTPTGGTARNVIRDSAIDDFIQVIGVPGDMKEVILTLESDPDNSDDEYELGVSNWYRVGSLDDPDVADEDDADYIALPDNIEIGTFVQSGRNIQIPIRITSPTRDDAFDIEFKGEADPFTGDNRNYDLTFALTAATTGANISTTTRSLRGAQGAVSFAEVIISPTVGRELDATTFSIDGTLPTGVTSTGFVQLGTSVIAEFTVTFQATNQSATITLDGDPSQAIESGVDTSIVTFDFTENITNVSTVADFSVTGVVGSVAQFNIPLYAADGYTLTAGNFSATESSSALTMFDAVGGGDSVQIPFRVTFPSDDVTIPITLTGSAQAVDAETTEYTVNFTNNIDNSSLTDLSETLVGVPDTVVRYTNTLTANDGFNLTVNDVTAPTGWAKSSAGNDAVNLTKLITFGATNTTENVTLNAAQELSAEPYTLQVNLTNNVTNTLLSRLVVPIGYDNGDIGTAIGSGNTFTIESTSDTMAFDAVTNINTPASGGVTVSYTIASGVITGTVGGNFPTPDDAGLAIVNLDINPGSGDSAETGSPPRLGATAVGTTLTSLTPGVSSNGGTAVFRLTTGGRWNASIQVATSDGQGLNNDSGSFSLSVGPSSNRGLLTASGSYTPTNGQAGTHLISLQMGQEPAYFNPAGNTGLATTFYGSSLTYTLIIHARNQDGSDGVEVARASVSQSHSYGGRTFVVPSTWTASEVANSTITTTKDTWTFYTS